VQPPEGNSYKPSGFEEQSNCGGGAGPYAGGGAGLYEGGGVGT